MEEKTKIMLKKYGPWAAGGIVLLLVGVTFVGAYNDLVAQEEGVTSQARQVDVAYQRAFRLVPALTDMAQEFLANETDVIETATQLRSGLTEAEDGSLQSKDAYLEDMVQFVALVGNRVEAYPELQSSDLYKDTMTEITNSENKIAAEKNRYNDRVQDYNAQLRTCCMPRVAASMFGFEPAEYIGFEGRSNTAEWEGGAY